MYFTRTQACEKIEGGYTDDENDFGDDFTDDDGIYLLSNDVDETLNLSYAYLPLIQIPTMLLYHLW